MTICNDYIVINFYILKQCLTIWDCLFYMYRDEIVHVIWFVHFDVFKIVLR